jgi:hypothetical protein
MLELPRDFQEVIALADWLELLALQSGDKNASLGDLLSALQIPLGREEAKTLTFEVMSEIEDRIKATGDAYPFSLLGSSVLQIKKDNLNEYVAYIFCLLLSYFGWKPVKNTPINPRLLFEDLACIAAKQYLQGDVLQFGTGRYNSSNVSTFGQLVTELCKKLGEGQGLGTKKTLNKKDDHVDLVAWKDFKDGRESKLILFGQCATGENWDSKVNELNPDAFCGNWMIKPMVSSLGRSFYVPHRISGELWTYHARNAGILFDRCRVAYWAWTDNNSVLKDPRFVDWCISTYHELANNGLHQ